MSWRGYITTDGRCRSVFHDPAMATCIVHIRDYADNPVTVSLSEVSYFKECPEGIAGQELGEVREITRGGEHQLRFCDHDDEVMLEVHARGMTIRLSDRW